MSVPTLNMLLRIALALLAVVGAQVAWYKGASWAHRKPGQSWWRTLSPDRLFRPDLHTPEGNALRRRAARSLAIFAAVGVLILIGIAYRNALETR